MFGATMGVVTACGHYVWGHYVWGFLLLQGLTRRHEVESWLHSPWHPLASFTMHWHITLWAAFLCLLGTCVMLLVVPCYVNSQHHLLSNNLNSRKPIFINTLVHILCCKLRIFPTKSDSNFRRTSLWNSERASTTKYALGNASFAKIFLLAAHLILPNCPFVRSKYAVRLQMKDFLKIFMGENQKRRRGTVTLAIWRILIFQDILRLN